MIYRAMLDYVLWIAAATVQKGPRATVVGGCNAGARIMCSSMALGGCNKGKHHVIRAHHHPYWPVLSNAWSTAKLTCACAAGHTRQTMKVGCEERTSARVHPSMTLSVVAARCPVLGLQGRGSAGRCLGLPVPRRAACSWGGPSSCRH